MINSSKQNQPSLTLESQHLQACVDLIQSLLDCPEGQEKEILAANQDLIDPVFLQVLRQVIAQAEQDNQPQVVEFLSQLSTNLETSIFKSLAERTPAYLQLIETLLSCPSGEEKTVLAAHSDLVDAGLVELMGQTAGTLAVKGKMNAANFLLNTARDLANQLGLVQEEDAPTIINHADSLAPIGINPPEMSDRLLGQSPEILPIPPVLPQTVDNRPKAYFLMRLLQVTKDSGGSPRAVYPLLEGNLHQFTASLITDFQAWSQATLPIVDANQAKGIAQDLCNLGTLLVRFPSRNEVALELAIMSYETAITVLTQTNSPTVWAAIQNNLGIAYCDRQYGEKENNLEKAIACFRSALGVYGRYTYPQDWAMTQNNLAQAYRYRIQGDRSENLQQAIACYEAAAEIYTLDKFPKQKQQIQKFIQEIIQEIA
ncbi:tetratricopeptide repeat protein [Anabaena minutissima FACHB-250]|nr:tetratricopeptide repeat protein [Anabaena minutissima FACHB-250]